MDKVYVVTLVDSAKLLQVFPSMEAIKEAISGHYVARGRNIWYIYVPSRSMPKFRVQCMYVQDGISPTLQEEL